VLRGDLLAALAWSGMVAREGQVADERFSSQEADMGIRRNVARLFASAALLGTGMAAFADPVEHITDGSFEAGSPAWTFANAFRCSDSICGLPAAEGSFYGSNGFDFELVPSGLRQHRTIIDRMRDEVLEIAARSRGWDDEASRETMRAHFKLGPLYEANAVGLLRLEGKLVGIAATVNGALAGTTVRARRWARISGGPSPERREECTSSQVKRKPASSRLPRSCASSTTPARPASSARSPCSSRSVASRRSLTAVLGRRRILSAF